MQIIVTDIVGGVAIELIDAPTLEGTEKQIAAAHGIRQRMLAAMANYYWATKKPTDKIQVAMNFHAAKFAAITSKQWLDANAEWGADGCGLAKAANLIVAMCK